MSYFFTHFLMFFFFYFNSAQPVPPHLNNRSSDFAIVAAGLKEDGIVEFGEKNRVTFRQSGTGPINFFGFERNVLIHSMVDQVKIVIVPVIFFLR